MSKIVEPFRNLGKMERGRVFDLLNLCNVVVNSHDYKHTNTTCDPWKMKKIAQSFSTTGFVGEGVDLVWNGFERQSVRSWSVRHVASNISYPQLDTFLGCYMLLHTQNSPWNLQFKAQPRNIIWNKTALSDMYLSLSLSQTWDVAITSNS